MFGKTLRRVGFAPLMGVLTVYGFVGTAGCSPAMASPQVSANGTGGGDLIGAVLQDSDTEKAHAQAKLNAAERVVAAASAQAISKGLVPTPEMCTSSNPCVPQAISLGVSHSPQSKNYYCGPAAGYMILRNEAEGASAYNGASLDQVHVAGPDHMQTDANGVTAWSSGLFRIGLNRWRQGTDSGFYVNLASPTNAEYATALQSDIVNSGLPFGASTYEAANKLHYNHHPLAQEIGHWIVVQGYQDYLATTSFDDPAANSSALSSAWADVNPNFTYDSDNFNQRFLQDHGITW